MNVIILNSFAKDVKKINNSNFNDEILNIITILETANSIQEIPHLKKLAGHKDSYRCRMGYFRIGINIENSNIILVWVALRKDFFRLFPFLFS